MTEQSKPPVVATTESVALQRDEAIASNKMAALDAVIDGMCMTYRHDFGLEKTAFGILSIGMDDKERDALRLTMRQIWQHNVAPYIASLQIPCLCTHSQGGTIQTPLPEDKAALDALGDVEMAKCLDPRYSVGEIYKSEFETILAALQTPSVPVEVVDALDQQWRNGISWAIEAMDRQTMINRLVEVCEKQLANYNKAKQGEKTDGR